MAESEPFNQCTQEFDGDAGLHQSGELSCGAMSQTWIRERLKRGRGVERVEQRVLERETERDRERQREAEKERQRDRYSQRNTETQKPSLSQLFHSALTRIQASTLATGPLH